MNVKPGRASVRARKAAVPVVSAEHRGFQLAMRPRWQPGATPGARRVALGLDASILNVRLHLGRSHCSDPRAIRRDLAQTIGRGPVEIELDGALTLVGYVERLTWEEVRDDQGEFAEVNLDLTLIGREV